MDRMNVFNDTVNEIFGCRELEWKSSSYPVDFSNRETLVNFINSVIGEDNLNEWIAQLPDELLESTPYRKYRETSGNENWVLYRDEQYEVSCDSCATLHYKGNSSTPEQPINCSSAYSLFRLCNRLKYLDLSKWDMSKIIDTSEMFLGCFSLESLNLAHWDTSNVIAMVHMFHSCISLKSLDIANWNVSNVRFMFMMFSNCCSLKRLDIGSWDTSKVMSMNFMFADCESLITLDLSGWVAENANTRDMFANCNSLITTNNGGFDELLGGK